MSPQSTQPLWIVSLQKKRANFTGKKSCTVNQWRSRQRHVVLQQRYSVRTTYFVKIQDTSLLGGFASSISPFWLTPQQMLLTKHRHRTYHECKNVWNLCKIKWKHKYYWLMRKMLDQRKSTCSFCLVITARKLRSTMTNMSQTNCGATYAKRYYV